VKYRFLFLLTLVSFTTFSAYSAAEPHLTICDRLLSSADPSIKPEDLPPTIEFSVSKERAQTYFELANNNFKQVLASENLDASLADVTADISKASLKRARKYGQLIRSSFEIFSEDHKAPKDLSRFVTDLGHLNDYLEGDIANLIPEQIKAVKKDLAAIHDTDWEKKFTPAKKKSIQEFIDDQIGELSSDLEKKKLKAKEFHEIRLLLKSLMNLYFFRSAFDESAETLMIYKFLLQLNQDMGLIHDDLVIQDNRGEIDYEQYKLKLSPSIREKISALLSRIR
jgi:hypothetical protein